MKSPQQLLEDNLKKDNKAAAELMKYADDLEIKKQHVLAAVAALTSKK